MAKSDTKTPAHTVTAYLTVKDTAKALEFYQRAFGAKELYRLTAPDGKVGHAEMMIGNTRLMLSDEFPEWGSLSPLSTGGTPVKFFIDVPDADAAFQRAVDAGGKPTRPVKTEFYGYRSGMITDAFGYNWFVSTKVEDVSPEEMSRRWVAMMPQPQTTKGSGQV